MSPRLERGIPERRRVNYYDSWVPLGTWTPLFSQEKHIGDLGKTNIMTPWRNHVHSDLSTLFVNVYARSPFGHSHNSRLAFDAWAHAARVTVRVGDAPRWYNLVLADLLERLQWLPDVVARQQMTPAEYEGFKAIVDECPPLVIPVRQSVVVEVQEDEGAYKALVAACGGELTLPRVFLHLEGMQTRDVC